MANVFDCSLFELNKYHYPEGNLTYVYQNIHVPFPINRVFYSYDIPAGEDRGAHAHKQCHQLIVAASGAFEVVLDDGTKKRTVTVLSGDYTCHQASGHQNKDSRRVVYVWYWPVMNMTKTTISVPTKSIWNLSNRKSNG